MNPYDAFIVRMTPDVLRRRPDDIRNKTPEQKVAHWQAQNEWMYCEMANLLLVGAYASTLGRAAPGEVRDFAVALFEALVDAATEDRWYHRQPGMGDGNVDRFALLPFLEAYVILEPTLPDALKEKILARAKGIFAVQYDEFGHGSRMKGGKDRLYPNMDVYYCLIMHYAHRLTGDDRYGQEFDDYVDRMGRAQFEDGGWTYIKGTNECPVYHGLNATVMARIAEVTGDPRAKAQVVQSVPYYPLVVGPTGIPEYHTDVWWKHGWSGQRSFAPDVVASVSGDAQNRWIGDLMREATLDQVRRQVTGEERQYNNIFGLMTTYAAMLWQDVAPGAPAEELVVYDRNIQGPRARFAGWSWAATARYGTDTVVGAYAHTPPDDLTALMAVVPEIDHRHPDDPDTRRGGFYLGITPPDTTGQTTIGDDGCTFRVTYRMATFRTIWGVDPFPKAWECSQDWQLDRRALCGTIRVRSLEDQQSGPPRVRIRFGRNGDLSQTGADTYTYGPFVLALGRSDFPERSIAPAPVAYYVTATEAVELMLHTRNPSEATYARNDTFELELRIEFRAP